MLNFAVQRVFGFLAGAPSLKINFDTPSFITIPMWRQLQQSLPLSQPHVLGECVCLNHLRGCSSGPGPLIVTDMDSLDFYAHLRSIPLKWYIGWSVCRISFSVEVIDIISLTESTNCYDFPRYLIFIFFDRH